MAGLALVVQIDRTATSTMQGPSSAKATLSLSTWRGGYLEGWVPRGVGTWRGGYLEGWLPRGVGTQRGGYLEGWILGGVGTWRGGLSIYFFFDAFIALPARG